MSEPREPNAYSAYNPDYFRDFPNLIPWRIGKRFLILWAPRNNGSGRKDFRTDGRGLHAVIWIHSRMGFKTGFGCRKCCTKTLNITRQRHSTSAGSCGTSARAPGILEARIPQKDTNPAIFVTRGSDGALRSNRNTRWTAR